MPTVIFRDEVRRLLTEGAQLVDVLPAQEYQDLHLPGAINIPLKQLTEQTAARLQKDKPVIVYCYDYQWDLSPRAAWRLESLGFTKVYDYKPGEADWFACGLPMEGTKAALPRVGGLARQDVPRCSLTDKMGDVKRRVEAAEWNICVVVNEESVVLGLLREQQLGGDPNATAGQVMRPGPATYRPDVPVADAVERMRKRGVQGVVITTSDGRLVGLLRLEDAAPAAAKNGSGHGG